LRDSLDLTRVPLSEEAVDPLQHPLGYLARISVGLKQAPTTSWKAWVPL
jgi:hypothetical protein